MKFDSQSKKAVLLDVRDPDEIALGFLSGAKNIPLPQLETRFGELSKNEPVYVYCKAGGRAQKAGAILENQGFTNVVCAINGGYGELSQLPRK